MFISPIVVDNICGKLWKTVHEDSVSDEVTKCAADMHMLVCAGYLHMLSIYIPVVPHKAVAEVSKIGPL